MKQDFPILKDGIVYLDSAASTQKPQKVIDAVSDFYKKSYSNIHRGSYRLSQKATEEYDKSRQTVADFINADFHEVVFTRNTTEGLNLVAYSLLQELNEGDEVLIPEMGHHSNMVPWQQLCKTRNLKLKFVKVKNKEIDLDDFKEKLSDKTRVVSLCHVSNVLGTINDVKKIRKIIGDKRYLVVDGAQAVGHLKVDVKELDCDFYAFSGHKMFGPSGIGVLYGKKRLLEVMKPFLYGGDMISDVQKEKTEFNEVPYKFEAGTPYIEGAVGLKAAIEYINEIGIENMHKKEEELRDYALEKLKEVDNLEVYSHENGIGLVSFNIVNDKQIHGHDVAYLLDEEGICVRTGYLCAQPLIQDNLGKNGVVRMSFHVYNDKEDIDKTVKVLKEIVEKFK